MGLKSAVVRGGAGAIVGAKLGGPLGGIAGGFVGFVSGLFSGSGNQEIEFQPAPRMNLYANVTRQQLSSYMDIKLPQLQKVVTDFFKSNEGEDAQLTEMKQNTFQRYLDSVKNLYKLGVSSPTAFQAMRNTLAQQNAIIGEINKAVENNDPNAQGLVLPQTIKNNLTELAHNLSSAQEYTAIGIKDFFRQQQTALTNELGEKANSSYGMNARAQLARQESEALTQNNIYWLTEGTSKALDTYKKALEVQHEQRMNPIREAVANEDQYLKQVLSTRELKRNELQDLINVKQTEYINAVQQRRLENAQKIEREILDLKKAIAQEDLDLRAYAAENNSPYVQSQLMGQLFDRKADAEAQLALDSMAFDQIKQGISRLSGRRNEQGMPLRLEDARRRRRP